MGHMWGVGELAVSWRTWLNGVTGFAFRVMGTELNHSA